MGRAERTLRRRQAIKDSRRAGVRVTAAEQPGSLHPFKRIKTLIAGMNAASAAFIASGTNEARMVLMAAREKLASYTSRGHGKGGHVKHKLNFEDRSKYTPAVEDRKHAMATAAA